MVSPQLDVCRGQAAALCSHPGFAEDTLGFGHLAATCCRASEKMPLLFLSESKEAEPFFSPAVFCSLRPLDIEFMKRLSKVVNIVPVIAKADTLTLEERDYFKQRVRKGPGVLGGAPQLPLPLSPGSFGKPSAWLGARRIPRAAALSDPMWQEGRPSLQTLPCVSLGSLSARSTFGARGLGACSSCLLCCCCCCCFGAGLGYFRRRTALHAQPGEPSLCHTATRQKPGGLLSSAGQDLWGSEPRNSLDRVGGELRSSG